MNMADEVQKSAMRRILRALNTSSIGVEASAAISSDGFVIASVLGDNADADRFGAMCASLIALADRAAQEVARGVLRQIVVEGESGTMLLIKAGAHVVLAMSTRPNANLGMVFIEAKKTAQKICDAMSPRQPATEGTTHTV